MAVGKNITWKKGKGKQYHLPCNIRVIGKNIKWGRGKEGGNFEEENKDLKPWGWEGISSSRNFIHPWGKYRLYLRQP